MLGNPVLTELQRLRIDDLAYFLPIRRQLGLVKTRPGFLAQELLVNHDFDEIRQNETIAPLVVGHQFIGVGGHVRQHVQAHQVGSFEHRRFGSTHKGAENGIHILDRKPLLLHQLHGLYHPLNPDAVCDKIGGVLGPDNSFPEDSFSEIGHEGEDFGQGFLTGDNFQQSHVANRIEKVGSQKMLVEFLAQARGHGLERNAGSVGGNDGTGFSDRLYPLEQLLFYFQVFHHHLDNPVTGG